MKRGPGEHGFTYEEPTYVVPPLRGRAPLPPEGGTTYLTRTNQKFFDNRARRQTDRHPNTVRDVFRHQHFGARFG